MKRILSVFPLLKTLRFYLITALLLLGAGLSGFLYLPEEKNEALPFEKEQDALEDALAAAEEKLSAIAFPEADKALIMERMARQKKNAREWCDIVNSFFYRFSGVEDAKGRPLYL